jgi:zinc transport system substrate-binding protein
MRTVLVIAAVLLLAGCGSSADNGRTTVVAGFYPLAWAAEAIGGPSVSVRNLTPAGAEPHDIELTPKEVGAIQSADVVLYLSHGFQPAVEQAVAEAKGTRFDALAGMSLQAGVGDEAGATDPHVWLDPVRFAQLIRRLGTALHHRQKADALAERVLALDGAYRRGLAHCRQRTFVSSHAAFAYMAARYGLKMDAITGVDPESEPAPRTLERLARLVRRDHISTVFFERLVSPKLAETVAREAGAKTAVLDPIEGLTAQEQHQGITYLGLMRQNLTELRKALGCR